MENEISSLNFFEELVAIKGALELDFVSIDRVCEALEYMYSKENKEQLESKLLSFFLDKEYLTQSQIEFLREGIEENREAKSPHIDIKDRNAVAHFLGIDISQEQTHSNKEETRELPETWVIKCPHCNAKFRIKKQLKSNKFKCGKCREYFFTSITNSSVEKPKAEKFVQSETPTSEQNHLRKLETVQLSRSDFIKMQEKIQANVENILGARPAFEKEAKPTSKMEEAFCNLLGVPKKDQQFALNFSNTLLDKRSPSPPASNILSKATDSSDHKQSAMESTEVASEPEQALWSSDNADAQPEPKTDQALWSSDNTDAEPEPETNQALWSSDNTGPEPELETNQALWSSDNTDAEPEPETDQALWSSDNAEPEPETNQALWSSDNAETKQGALWSSNMSVADENLPQLNLDESPIDTEADDIKLDGLQIPADDSITNAADLLNISSNVAPAQQESTMGTMELDIRATHLFSQQKKKPGKETTKAFEELTRGLSPIEGLVILKHAVNYDFIGLNDLGLFLDMHYNAIEQGAANENFANLLLIEGYITKFQYSTLIESLEKDKKAKRIPVKLDVTDQKQVEKFLGSTQDKKIMRISCPHCKTSFRARINVKGGKFRCGKCRKSFFLTKKK